MSANVVEAIGRTYPNAINYYSDTEDVFVGGIYLIARDYDTPKIIVATQVHDTNKRYAVYEGRAYRAGLLNHPKTKVGDFVGVLETADGATFRRDRRYQITEMTDDGPRVVSVTGTGGFIAKFWVLHSDNDSGPRLERTDPNRRAEVIDRLSREGMNRLGDTGYATSAREFFDKFDLPHPDVFAHAMVDVEQTVTWGEMGYDMRDMFTRRGMTTARSAIIRGRMKVKMQKGPCRCKDVTFEEVKQAAARGGVTVTEGTLHRVQCMWCVPVSEINDLV